LSNEKINGNEYVDLLTQCFEKRQQELKSKEDQDETARTRIQKYDIPDFSRTQAKQQLNMTQKNSELSNT